MARHTHVGAQPAWFLLQRSAYCSHQIAHNGSVLYKNSNLGRPTWLGHSPPVPAFWLLSVSLSPTATAQRLLVHWVRILILLCSNPTNLSLSQLASVRHCPRAGICSGSHGWGWRWIHGRVWRWAEVNARWSWKGRIHSTGKSGIGFSAGTEVCGGLSLLPQRPLLFLEGTERLKLP